MPWDTDPPPGWKCSECDSTKGFYNNRSQVCSPKCARTRKTRLQKKRRDDSRDQVIERYRRRQAL